MRMVRIVSARCGACGYTERPPTFNGWEMAEKDGQGYPIWDNSRFSETVPWVLYEASVQVAEEAGYGAWQCMACKADTVVVAVDEFLSESPQRA